MLEVRCDLDFAQEALDAEHGAEVGAQHLERDPAIVLEVAREVDGRHPAGTEFTFDVVAIAEGGVQLGDGVHVSGRASRPSP